MIVLRFLRLLAAASLLVSLLPGSAKAQASRYDAFYVFGDSLADNGNVWLATQALVRAGVIAPPALPPSEDPHLAYADGRFSNGPVAFEYLWQQIAPGAPPLLPYMAVVQGLAPSGPAVNFAFGGTGTPLLDYTPGGLPAPGLLGQIELFRGSLMGRRVPSGALFAIVTGANDYTSDAFGPALSPSESVANIVEAVRRLQRLGARDVIVLTVPNLGCTPQASPLLPGAECLDEPTPPFSDPLRPSEVSALHNQLLMQQLARHRWGQTRVRTVDVNPLFSALRTGMAAPWWLPALDVLIPTPILLADGGLAPMSACLFVDAAQCASVPEWARLSDGSFATPFPLLFWDVVHPTTWAHAALAQHLAAILGY
jgi:hypothetical protein